MITAEDARRGIAEAREDFRRGVLEATVCEMSEKDLAFALAMLDDSDGSRLVDIAARMDVTNGYASIYKRRLLKKGVVGERPGGRLDFDTPPLYVSIWTSSIRSEFPPVRFRWAQRDRSAAGPSSG